MKLAAGLHSQTTAAAISSGFAEAADRLGGDERLDDFGFVVLRHRAAIGVLPMMPGHTALMRMPLAA